MTPEEHELVIEMFRQQTLYYAGLVELLKSRKLIDAGDLQAFDALVSASSRQSLEWRVKEDYLTTGKILGVTGLPVL